MASVNKVILVGNCGRDPEMRILPSGKAVANVSIATTDKWKDKQTGEMKEATEWHRVVFYDRLAEIAGDYIKKGRQLYVEGHLKYGKYTDKDGVEKYTTDIVGNELQLLGPRDDQDGGQQQQRRDEAPQQQRQQPQGGYQQRPQPQGASRPAAPARPAAQGQRAPAHAGGGSGFDDMRDDVPF